MDQTKKNIKLIVDQKKKIIELLKARLSTWVEAQNEPIALDVDPRNLEFFGPYSEINAALLETAIDRMLALLGEADTRNFLLNALARRADAYKNSLT